MDINEYLKFAEKLALEAGEIMLKYFKQGIDHRFKKNLSIVTKADEEINKLVIDKIGEKYPTHSVFGEEESSDKKSDLVWLCDPVDGTWPYSKGIPVSAFSLALAENGNSFLGIVYEPFTKRLYSAVKGKGAFLNNKGIKVSNLTINEATLNIEWWPEAEYDIDEAMHKLSKATAAYALHLGSVVNASCFVAAGQYEACIYAGTEDKSVDIAAVKVIVEEAGGKVTDLFGNEQMYIRDLKGAILSNGVTHNKILEYTKDLQVDPEKSHAKFPPT